MKRLIPVHYKGNLYEVTVLFAPQTILHICKVSEDSGMCRDVRFDQLAPAIQARILHELNEQDE